MEYIQIDLNSVCRTCKNESSEMKSLSYRDSESNDETPRLDEMLMACASVHINLEDGLPKSVCLSCFLQLKNAYSFKKQCEKTDLFLRDYLRSLKKENIKEEITTDLEFTPNIISEIDVAQINSDDGVKNGKADSDPHSGESRERDVDYVQVVGSDLAIYECRTCSKVCYTLEDLRCHKRTHTNNVVDQVKMDIEDNTITFPKMEVKEEETEGTEEEAEVDNDNEYESDATTHSEYLPTHHTPSKIKRDRGRPRKHPVSFEPIDQSREHPSQLKLKTEYSKNEIGNFPCPQCKEVFATMGLLEKHSVQHDDLRIHECDLCDKKFRRRHNLKQHKLSHADVKAFVCMICRKCFKRKNNLQMHMKLHSSAEAHSCDLCQAVFNRSRKLAKHKDLIHDVGERNTGEKKYKCQYCQKCFTTEKYRNSHAKDHFGERKFKCRTCEKAFISKSQLTGHMKFHNDSSKKFLCSECGRRFIRKHDLVNHMMRHRGEKPFECKFCGKGFTRMAELTVHERYHTGEKTHLCGICGKGFGRAYNLMVHMRTHTGEKPYRCTYCDAAFTQSYDLKAHIRRHTGERFQCEFCPKTFVLRYLLTQHKRVVHGLNIVSNRRRLQPINKLNPDDPPPVTVSDPLQSQQSEVSDSKQEEKSDII